MIVKAESKDSAHFGFAGGGSPKSRPKHESESVLFSVYASFGPRFQRSLITGFQAGYGVAISGLAWKKPRTSLDKA